MFVKRFFEIIVLCHNFSHDFFRSFVVLCRIILLFLPFCNFPPQPAVPPLPPKSRLPHTAKRRQTRMRKTRFAPHILYPNPRALWPGGHAAALRILSNASCKSGLYKILFSCYTKNDLFFDGRLIWLFRLFFSLFVYGKCKWTPGGPPVGFPWFFAAFSGNAARHSRSRPPMTKRLCRPPAVEKRCAVRLFWYFIIMYV